MEIERFRNHPALEGRLALGRSPASFQGWREGESELVLGIGFKGVEERRKRFYLDGFSIRQELEDAQVSFAAPVLHLVIDEELVHDISGLS